MAGQLSPELRQRIELNRQRASATLERNNHRRCTQDIENEYATN